MFTNKLVGIITSFPFFKIKTLTEASAEENVVHLNEERHSWIYSSL